MKFENISVKLKSVIFRLLIFWKSRKAFFLWKPWLYKEKQEWMQGIWSKKKKMYEHLWTKTIMVKKHEPGKKQKHTCNKKHEREIDIKNIFFWKKNYMQLYRMLSYIKVKSCGGTKTSWYFFFDCSLISTDALQSG